MVEDKKYKSVLRCAFNGVFSGLFLTLRVLILTGAFLLLFFLKTPVTGDDVLIKKDFMLRAIELAKRGEGKVNPNPLVGAVIVKDGRIISEGWHQHYGGFHAERNAIMNCGEDMGGADIYVTLEPCCHYGKTPPCTEIIIESGIKRVIVGSRDPNPLVSGKGNDILRQNGIEVVEDFLKDQCDALNLVFFKYISTKIPYVSLKYAMTLDGKIATSTGESKWITNEKSRENVHVLRNKYMAIMAGIGTVISDNPMLNCRIEGGRNPIRVICDSNLKIPLSSNIVESAKEIKTIIACCEGDYENEESLKKMGCRIIKTKNDSGHVDLKELMEFLGNEGIDSVLVEGGGQINYSILKAGVVDEINAYIAGKIFGGNGKSPVSGEGVKSLSEAFKFKLYDWEMFDGDMLLRYLKED